MQDSDYTKKKKFINLKSIETKNDTNSNLSVSIPKSSTTLMDSKNPFINSDIENYINSLFNDKTNRFDLEDSNYEDLNFINKYFLLEKNEYFTIKDENSLFSAKKKLNNKKRKKEHSKFEKDNVLKKINIHYISFIVKFINYKIKNLLSKHHPLFSNLSYNFKRKININNFNELKNKTIGEVIKNEGSNKNKRNIIYQKNENEKIFNLVYNTELKELLDMNYIHFFQEIYAKTNEERNMENYKKHKYPKDILFFDDFLKSEAKKDKINGELYKERLKYVSKSEFISKGYPFFETKIICKKNIKNN